MNKYLYIFLTLFCAVSSRAQTDSIAAPRFLFKIDPGQLVFGEFPAAFEVPVARKISIEATVGVTQSDFAWGRYYMVVPKMPFTVMNYDEVYSPGTGYSLSGGIRFYLLSEDVNGVYFTFRAQYRKYVNKLRFQDLRTTSSTEERGGILMLGYQHIFGERFLIDVYGGFNAIWMNGVFPYIGENVPPGSPPQPYDHWNIVSSRQYEFLPIGGVRLGIAF